MDHDADMRVAMEHGALRAIVEGARDRALRIYRSATFMRVAEELRHETAAARCTEDLADDLREHCHLLGVPADKIQETARDAAEHAARVVKEERT